MVTFDPKSAFILFHQPEAERLMEERESRWLTLALNSSLAQLALTSTDAAELKGARRLVDTLLNLSDKSDVVAQYPVKELKTLDK